MVETSYHAPSALDLRQRSLLGFVRTVGGATRAEIAAATNMSPSMVVRLVGELVGLGLLANDEARTDARPGRPSEVLRLNGRAGFGVGLEFGRDTLTTVVTDALGDLVAAEHVADVPPFVADEAVAERLAGAVRGAASRAGIDFDRVEAVGVALHDIVDAQGAWVVKGGPRAAPFPIRERLEAALDIPTAVEDVSRAFAEAEFRSGAGADVADMAYVFIGRYGVGSGIFVNGQLLRSSSGVCGEIGHVIVEEGGPLCVCGSLGCLETVALHDAVIGRYRALLAQGVVVPVPAADSLTFGDICAAAGAGDKAATIVLDQLAHAVGVAVACVVSLAGTPHIVIGGDLVHAGDVFLHELAATVRRRVISSLSRQLTVRYALLPAHAGAQGAALQALHAAWTQGPMLERAMQRRLGQGR